MPTRHDYLSVSRLQSSGRSRIVTVLLPFGTRRILLQSLSSFRRRSEETAQRAGEEGSKTAPPLPRGRGRREEIAPLSSLLLSQSIYTLEYTSSCSSAASLASCHLLDKVGPIGKELLLVSLTLTANTRSSGRISPTSAPASPGAMASSFRL